MSLPIRHAPNHYASSSIISPPLSTLPNNFGFDRRTSGYDFPQTSAPQRAGSRLRLGPQVKRLFKFPQMDFELAGWEILNLMVAPRRAWRGVWYRRQTQTTPTPSDPALPYLLSAFLFLTSLAWSLAYASPSFGNIVRIAFWFVFVHFLGLCALSATFGWLLVGRALGPGGWAVKFGGSAGGGVMGRFSGIVRGKRRGLFGDMDGDGKEGLTWGFAFEVAIRSFVPAWIYLYVIQFLLLPVITPRHWPSTLLTNALHLLSLSHTTYITFLGYNSIPSLTSTHLLLAPPLLLYLALFLIAMLSGWNASLHLAPVLWCWGGLRGVVGGG